MNDMRLGKTIFISGLFWSDKILIFTKDCNFLKNVS